VKKAPSALGTKRAMIAHMLSEDIGSGKYPVGSNLPSENDLAQSFGVSRHTIRVALTSLQESGLIASRQGIGNIVRNSSAPVRYVQAFDSLNDILQYAATTPVKIVDKAELTVDAALAAWLGCKSGERWWRVRTIRFSQDKKVCVAVTDIYIPYIFGSILNHLDESGGTVLTLIEGMLGKSIVEVRQEIASTKASAADASILNVRPLDPMLTITRHYFGSNGQLLEVSRAVHPGEIFGYSLRIRLARDSAY
jgi:GntR family transcriptional regulator